MTNNSDRSRARRGIKPALEAMEGRVVLSSSAIHSKVMSVVASERGPTELERRFLDGLNASLEPDLTFSPGAKEAMTRVPFSYRNDIDAYKAKLRGNKVAFKESGSIVVIKGTFIKGSTSPEITCDSPGIQSNIQFRSPDIQSYIDDFTVAFRGYRRRNRAYASHTAAGVLIDPSSGTIRVLTFLPAKSAAPPKPVARALAGSYVVRSVDGLVGIPSGVALGSGDRKDLLLDTTRTLKGLTFEFAPLGKFKVSRPGTRNAVHPEGTYQIANGGVQFDGLQDEFVGTDIVRIRISGGGSLPKRGNPLKVTIALNHLQTTSAAGSTGRSYTATVRATLV
jgi:hypothetical protein